MGRARRLFRGRHNDGWRKTPRFELGAEVYCNYQGLWTRGVVACHHYRLSDRASAVYPYQVRLEGCGRLIYAPDDDDSCIHRVPRIAVGAFVECNLGEDNWVPGRVVAHSYEEPGHRQPYPYQMELLDGDLIYAPADDESFIRDTSPAERRRIAELFSEARASQTTATKGVADREPNSERADSPAVMAAGPVADVCDGVHMEHYGMMKNVLASWRAVCNVEVDDQQGCVISLLDDEADTVVKSMSPAPHCTSEVSCNAQHDAGKRWQCQSARRRFGK